MPTPNKIKKIAEAYGEPAVDIVLRVLNEQKTIQRAAGVLNLTEANLFRWASRNGIEKQTTVIWVKKSN